MSRSKGRKIVHVNNLEEATTSPSLLILSLKKEDEERYLGNSAASDSRRRHLPARLLLTKDAASSAAFPICRISSEKSKQIMKLASEEDIILACYDIWLECLLGKKELSQLKLSIFFDDANKSEEWENLWKGLTVPLLGGIEFPRNPDGPLRDINIWRHVPLAPDIQHRKPIYYEHVSYSNHFFSFLYSIPVSEDTFLAQYVIRQVLESALLRIVVVDDRIVQALHSRRNASEKIISLKFMGIYIAKKIIINGREYSLIRDDVDADDLVELDLSIPNGNDYDLMFIHQTIFENHLEQYVVGAIDCRIDEASKNTKISDWIFEVKKQIPYVVFHSGRGLQTERLPANVSFVEYSVLQQYILDEPSKFFLAQIGLNSKRS